VAARTQRPPQDGDVSISIPCLDHEVKHRAVMPEIKTASEVVDPDIGLHPRHWPLGRAKLGTGALKRRLRNVRHRHVGIAAGYQKPRQLRGSTADIKDRGVQREARFLNQRKGDLGHRLIPAQLLGLSLHVEPFPVRLGIHHTPDCDAKSESWRQSVTAPLAASRVDPAAPTAVTGRGRAPGLSREVAGRLAESRKRGQNDRGACAPCDRSATVRWRLWRLAKQDRYLMSTTEIPVDVDVLRAEIRKTYTEVSTEPGKEFIFPTGRAWACELGYPEPELSRVPDATVESFAGVANHWTLGRIRPGEVVLDLGCGAGTDLLLAAQMAGPQGRAIGVDMTAAMLEQARASARKMGLANVELHESVIESLPIDDASVDVVISNGVIDLVPDKNAVFDEIDRVLKPGGRLQIADVVIHHEVSEDARKRIDLWTG
jgi:arsenite methyltransferase